jgi:hypothetical protein
MAAHEAIWFGLISLGGVRHAFRAAERERQACAGLYGIALESIPFFVCLLYGWTSCSIERWNWKDSPRVFALDTRLRMYKVHRLDVPSDLSAPDLTLAPAAARQNKAFLCGRKHNSQVRVTIHNMYHLYRDRRSHISLSRAPHLYMGVTTNTYLATRGRPQPFTTNKASPREEHLSHLPRRCRGPAPQRRLMSRAASLVAWSASRCSSNWLKPCGLGVGMCPHTR